MKSPVQISKGAGVRLGVRGAGMLLTFFAVAVIELLNRYTDIEILNPGIIVAIPVVFTVLREGLISGLASVAVGILYYAYFFSTPGKPFDYTYDEYTRMAVVTASTLVITALTGSFKNAYEAVIRRRAAQEKHEALEESAVRFRTLVEQSTLGIQIASPTGETLQVNKAWERLWGLTLGQLQASGHNILHDHQLKAKGLLPYVRRAFQGEDISIPPMEYDPQASGLTGHRRWVRLRIYPLRNNRGKIQEVVIMYEDITEQRQAEMALRQAKRQQDIVLSNVSDGITLTAADSTLLYANDEAARIFGFASREEFLKTTYADLLLQYEMVNEHGTVLSQDTVPHLMEAHMKKGTEMIVRMRSLKTGVTQWLAVRSKLVMKDGSAPVALNVLRDITDEKFAEERRRRRLQRQEFLARAGEILVSEQDGRSALRKVAELAVPDLADWCTVNLVNPQGAITEFVITPEDSPYIGRIKAFHERRLRNDPPTSADGNLLSRVVKTGKTVFMPEMAANEHFSDAHYTPEQLGLFREIGLTSAILVPLKVQQEVIGVLVLATSGSRERFTDEDVAVAENVARLAALMVLNSRRFDQVTLSARREHEQAVLLDILLDRAPIGFALIGTDMRYIRINEYLAQVNGIPATAHVGKTVREMLPAMADSVERNVQQVVETDQPILNSELTAADPRDSGQTRHWIVSYYPVRLRNNRLLGVGVVINEVTAERAAQKEVYYRAHHDSLTSLPNRKSFEETMVRVLSHAQSTGGKFAIMFLDMDRLKTINDTLGHDVGDLVLQETAKRLKSVIRYEDFLCRWAGDEFVILLPEIAGIADAVRVAERLNAAMLPAIRLQNHTLHASVSIGIAFFPHDGEDLSTLQRNADTAMYRAKDTGKNRYELYDPTMNIKAVELLGLENDLRQALEREELQLSFQPIYDLKSGAISCVETLLRWKHPKKGLLKPAEFLTIAEETGLIVPIGQWAIAKAAELNRQWQEAGIYLKTVVNVSPRQFSQESLVDDVLSALRKVSLETKHFEIEITENMAMENLERTRSKLKELKDAGIDITIDDFGTGYSSLNYLKRFPVHQLKIDKSFVRHLITDEQDLSIIRAIISLAKSLKLRVVAEGVNTDTQMSVLQSLGCDAIQGYIISPPLTSDELVHYLRRNTLPGPGAQTPEERQETLLS